jgi:peptidoglycan biosynthesis protein MviN/MurJ (putative lipid II flippase)
MLAMAVSQIHIVACHSIASMLAPTGVVWCL